MNLEMMEGKEERIPLCLFLVDRMAEQITMLLNLGKLESNLVPIPKREQDLSVAVEDAVCGIEALAIQKNIKIICDLPENCSFVFHYFWMREAIDNILKNACEYSPAGAELYILLREKKNSYILTVDDQAGGVKRPDIFDRYAASEGDGRYGIGLHLSKVIIENHFGSIRTAENEIGGTKFIISLPILSGSAPDVTES